MSYTVTEESFSSLISYWTDSRQNLNWSSIFVTPLWWQVWWQELEDGAELHLGAVRQKETVIGIAPLLVQGEKVSLLGSADVCDYLDFVIAPGREREFFSALLDDWREKGLNQLDLGPLRPDSTVLTDLVDIVRSRGDEILCQPEDISLELDLPPTWNEYLALLTAKQRHEVRRKLRRLTEAGRIDYRIVDKVSVPEAMDVFLKMFTESRQDKADFMTERRASFFRSMAYNLAEAGLLRLGILELDTLPTAMVLCFDYNNCMYLYNSAYDPQYKSLSAGLLSKVLCIKESIQEGKKRFDFLKGDETYKHHLGGKEISLFRCQITIK